MKLLEAGDGSLASPLARDREQSERIVESARNAMEHHAAALRAVGRRIDPTFAYAASCLLALRGRVIVTGLGKSGIIGRKIASTFASTGTPSFFLHAAEALHGDLGMVTPEDAVLLVSYSGKTPEVLALVPHLRRRGVLTLGLVGDTHSELATSVDFVLDASVPGEACPYDLVPTTSTVAALALGDALALAIMEARGFGPEDFAKHHPGGCLGERLRSEVVAIHAPQRVAPARG
jgi:arabinose-5-phosphate isomerase